ncbi:MAG: hypothetical protein M3142_13500 [Bacteroidota bacterium]|nr:hypothetical protein [Bacteroidota bacterium]
MKTRKTQEKPSAWREVLITGIKAIAFLSAVFELVKGIYKFLVEIGVL